MRRVFDRTLRPAWVRLRDLGGRLAFERRYDIETSEEVGLEELGIAARDRKYYKPTGWLTLRRVLPRREVSSEDVFIDYGSGMGRVVFQAAASYPFRRVIGLELSERLNEIARANVERNRERLRCRDVEIVTADALAYELPPDVTVAFFANPFTGDLFGAVIDRLLEGLDRHPRRLRLIYHNPVEHERLMATGRVRPVRRLRGWRPGADWSRSNSTRMYEVLPG